MNNASRYDYQFDPDGDSTPARVTRLAGSGRDVLELGCAGGAMSAVLSGHYGCRIIGVEMEEAAAEQARAFCQQVIVANLDAPGWETQLEGASFDTVVVADVLEHLRDPLDCLKRVRRLLKDDGQLIVSVPNIAHGGVLAALLANDFPYRETGLLDRTHVHFFTSLTLDQMLLRAGFQIDTLETVDAGPWHPEFSRYWDRLPPAFSHWLRANPAGQAFQIVLRARPAEAPRPYANANALAEAGEAWLAALPLGGTEALQNEIAALRTQLQTQQHAQAAAQVERDEARAAVHAITASTSWRLTAPLRCLMKMLKPRT
jgi:2-polyprenyl-3-methyl-5-hydroxy-6-metoxy-1,4-benzoquinol methylase